MTVGVAFVALRLIADGDDVVVQELVYLVVCFVFVALSALVLWIAVSLIAA